MQKGHFSSGIVAGSLLMFTQVTLDELTGQRERDGGRGWEEKVHWKWEGSVKG